MSVRRPDGQREKLVLLFDHPSTQADIDHNFWQAPQAFRVLDVRYINPTGLAQSGTDFATGSLLNGAAVVAALFDTEADDLVADTFAAADVVAAEAVGAAGDELILSLDITDGGGTPTLPAGRIQVEIEYF